MDRQEQLIGLALGTAVGDALGLPMEGLSPQRARLLFPEPWRQRLVMGRGLISDDTEHMVFVAQSLLTNHQDSVRFARRLARSLRWWLLSGPPGVGTATLRATLKLWMGFRPEQSGVFRAGNGPLMRAPLIGAFFAENDARRIEFVRASTRLTHTHPHALIGATLVAELAALIVRAQGRKVLADEFLSVLVGPDEAHWQKFVQKMSDAVTANASVHELAVTLGLGGGVTGYALHSASVAMYAWWRHQGCFEDALIAILRCGGDTDSTGAVVGALAGLQLGERAIPQHWLERVVDWPRGIPFIRETARRVAEGKEREVGYFWPALPFRNLFMGLWALGHGFRRLLPPYKGK